MKTLFAAAALALLPTLAHADEPQVSTLQPRDGEQTCREGQIEMFLEGSGSTTWAYYICRNGRFVRFYY